MFKAGQRASTAEQRAAKASAQAGQLLAEVNADAGRHRAATRREVDDLTLTGTEVQVQRAVNVWESEVTVLMPMVVVGAPATPWQSWTGCSRAGRDGRGCGRGCHPGPDGLTRSEVTIELVFDPPGHVRLAIDDDEIIDRALAVGPLADRKVTLLTYDTGQSTRARNAGLAAVKLNQEAGEEPK